MRTDPLTRFFGKVVLDLNTGCWLWQAARNKRGYGRFGVGGKVEYAHRWAYEYFIGPIPEGLETLHMCDTPQCVNPHHLVAGTHLENMLPLRKPDCPRCGRPWTRRYRQRNRYWAYCRPCETKRRRRCGLAHRQKLPAMVNA